MTTITPSYDSASIRWKFDSILPYSVTDTIIIYVFESDTGAQIILDNNTFVNSPDFEVTVTGLNPLTNYTITVAGSNSYGVTPYLNSSFTTGIYNLLYLT